MALLHRVTRVWTDAKDVVATRGEKQAVHIRTIISRRLQITLAFHRALSLFLLFVLGKKLVRNWNVSVDEKAVTQLAKPLVSAFFSHRGRDKHSMALGDAEKFGGVVNIILRQRAVTRVGPTRNWTAGTDDEAARQKRPSCPSAAELHAYACLPAYGRARGFRGHVGPDFGQSATSLVGQFTAGYTSVTVKIGCVW